MIIPPGATSQTIQVQIVDDSGLAVTGLVAATFPTVYYSRAGETLPSAVTLSDLAAQNSAYSSGGVKELTGGYYRLDVPNAAFATASKVRIIGEASGKHLLYPTILCANVQAVDSSGAAIAPAATALSTAEWTGTRAGYLDNLSSAPPGAAVIADAVWDEALSGHQTAGSAGAIQGTVTDKTGFALTSAYDFAKGTAAMTEAYAANGAAPTPVQALYAIHQHLMGFTISGTNYTVKRLDGSTTAYVATLNDGTSPTGVTRS